MRRIGEKCENLILWVYIWVVFEGMRLKNCVNFCRVNRDCVGVSFEFVYRIKRVENVV